MKKILTLLFIAPFIFAMSSCDDEEDETSITLQTAEVSLKPGDTYQIEARSDNAITYTSENGFHASVSNKGEVTAEYVGETNILLNNGKDIVKFKVTVTPQYTFFNTPFIEWGTSRSDIIKKFENNEYTEDEATIDFDGLNTSSVYFTRFILENNKLASTAIYLSTEDIDEAGYFLLERYEHLGYDQIEDEETGDLRTVHFFTDAFDEEDATLMIYLLEINDDIFAIAYMPLEADSSSTEKSIKTAKAFSVKNIEAIKKLNK